MRNAIGLHLVTSDGDRPVVPTPAVGLVSPSHPAAAAAGVPSDHPSRSAPRLVAAALGGDGAAGSSSSSPPPRRGAGGGGPRRPTPLESGLAAVARHDVHIERVWPMRSPPIGPLEAPSSAYFQMDRRGTPPAGIEPVGGLRMSQAFAHEPVMVEEVTELLAPVPPGLVLDATVGGGGHAAALLDRHEHLEVLGIDRDPDAVSAARDTLAPFGDRAAVRQRRFDELAGAVRERQRQLGRPGRGLSAAVFDLGVSSPQLDISERGFSYRRDAPLDMRMDPTSGRTAADVVNGFDEDALARLFADNGEGRFARRIARAVVVARPIATTGELAEVVRAAIPAAARRTGGHPARRVFQAVRIAVNEEIEQLRLGLDAALDMLEPGGRCLVIAYHSGEDRVVKSVFVRAATGDCRCPPGLPCVCGAVPAFRLVTRGARRPSAAEVSANRRAESARLRVIERLPAVPEPPPGGGEVA